MLPKLYSMILVSDISNNFFFKDSSINPKKCKLPYKISSFFFLQEYLEKESQPAKVHHGVLMFTELLLKRATDNTSNVVGSATPVTYGEKPRGGSGDNDASSLFTFGVKTRSHYLGEVRQLFFVIA